MSYYSEDELREKNFEYLGNNVKISKNASIYNEELISIGDNSRIDDFCVLSGNISIGRNVHIAVFCNLVGGEKGIVMEDFSGLSFRVCLFAQSDDYTGSSMTNPTIPDIYKNITKKQIIIKKHAIIGANSLIFPGVTVAEGCAIGAMSMVIKDTESWKKYFGIPARVVGNRENTLLELEANYINDTRMNK